MRLRLPFAIIVQSCIFATAAPAQSYFYNNSYYDAPMLWETGINLGAMNCLTDLGGHSGRGRSFIKDINLPFTRPCMGIYGSFQYEYIIGARLEFSLGSITAADSILKHDRTDARYRYQRNLHFRSRIREALLMLECHPLSWLALSRGRPVPLCSPYLLVGIGLFSFRPEAQWENSQVALQPLHTEGQGFPEYPQRIPYRLTQLHFPAGAGIKYELSAHWNLRLEVVYRFLQTDYLDDVSTDYINPSLFWQRLPPAIAAKATDLANRRITVDPDADINGYQRGNPSRNDAFFSCQLKLGYTLNRQKRKHY